MLRPLQVSFILLSACLLIPVSNTTACAQSTGSASLAQPFAALVSVSPKMACESLASVDVSSAVGTATHIASAVAVPDGKPAPYCDVKGTIAPQIGFRVMLPLSGWTQRYLQTGCGGFCGSVGIRLENAENCTPATNGELVMAATDMGHSGTQMSDASAMTGPQARIDFAYRGQHLTTLAAKALIEKFYGQGPKYSYFSGCSDGGREGLMEAQRFPNDFDGIISGDPASNFISQNTFGSAWSRYVNRGSDGKAIFTADKLVLLHNAVLAQCDAADGAKDGLISDPLSCHFDAAVIQCMPDQDAATCLTPAQAKVVNEIYAGPHDAAGNRLAPGGFLPGSEVNWAGPVIPRAGEDVGVSEMAESAYKYLALEKNPPETASSSEIRFDRASFQELTKLASLYDATDPDLSAFSAHGGKLILYHGLADPAISPINTILYYTEVQRKMGDAAVNKFARLYLFPGVSHCGGGEGPFHPDFLSAMMNWVENSQAPKMLASARYSTDMKVVIGMPPGGGAANQRPQAGQSGPGGPGGPGGADGPGGPVGPPGQGGGRPNFPQAPVGPPERTLTVFPYPATPKYIGTGNVTDATNFVSNPSRPISANMLEWLGSVNYRAKLAVWCEAKGETMSCKPQ